jgi:intracellular sulfur oxidation DsrE/DsrF family protein
MMPPILMETQMSILRQFIAGATVTIISLLIGVSISRAEEAGALQVQKASPAATPKSGTAMKHGNDSSANALAQKRSALARMTTPSANNGDHRLILQVNTNDSAMMNLALNNATNVAQYYKDLGEKVRIEVITFGPGLHMLRNDTSPVKARIEEMALSTPEVSFKACGNTQAKMQTAESKDIPIVPQAQVVKSGVVRVMELQERGWTYVKP